MTDRPTKEITTPSGALVVIKTYLTGREGNAISRALYGDIMVGVDDLRNAADSMAMRDFPASNLTAQTEEAIRQLVVSVTPKDGAKIDGPDAAYDLPLEDYNVVVEEVNKIQSPLVKPKQP